MKATDEDLVLYADGGLSVEQKQRLIQAAAHDTQLANTLEALDASQLPYHASYAQNEPPPVPDQLREDIHNLVRFRSDNTEQLTSIGPVKRVWPIRFAQAAGVAICVGAGYLAGMAHQDSSATAGGNTVASADIGQHTRQLEWVRRVADYQSLYVPNTTKNIEADVPASLAMLNQLALSTGIRTAIPDLTKAGYKFIRAQELGFEGEPLVQLVYSKEGSPPLAFCFMPANGEDDTRLQLASYHGLGAASWIKGNQRFVIVAEEPAQILEELYTAASASFPKA